MKTIFQLLHYSTSPLGGHQAMLVFLVLNCLFNKLCYLMASMGHKKLSGAQNRAKAKKKADEVNKINVR
jgi:hypothetical protein